MGKLRVKLILAGLLLSVLLVSFMSASQTFALHKQGPIPIPGDLVFKNQSIMDHPGHGKHFIPIHEHLKPK